jgi:hypothetical protein
MTDTDQGRFLRGFGQSAVERIRTNSAMNPLLWLNGCSLPFTIPGSVWAPHPINLCFVVLAMTTTLSAILAYFVWMFKDPNRLQSEDYQLANQRMLLGDERHPGVIIDGRASVPNDPTPRLGGRR